MVDLDDPEVNLVPVQTTLSSVQPENPPPSTAKTSYRIHPSVLTKRPPNLVLDEDYAWKTFKGVITDKEVSACYDMSVKDFERSAIHNLFKVLIFLSFSFYFLRNLQKISNSPSSIRFSSHGKVLHRVKPSQGTL